MKIYRLLTLVFLFAGTNSLAQMHNGGDEAFDLIVDSIDADTAADLSATRDSISVLRDELTALRGAEVTDQEAIDALRDELHVLRQSLREEIRDIVDNNDELQAELRILAQEARELRVVGRYVLRSDEAFDEIIAVATTEQANTLLANQGVLDSLKSEIQAARDAGATRQDVSDLAAELRTLADEQRSLVGEVVDANEDLLAGVLEDARSAREGIRERHSRHRRPGQGG